MTLVMPRAASSRAMMSASRSSREMSLLITDCRMNGVVEVRTARRVGSVGKMAAGSLEATTTAEPGLTATMASEPLGRNAPVLQRRLVRDDRLLQEAGFAAHRLEDAEDGERDAVDRDGGLTADVAHAELLGSALTEHDEIPLALVGDESAASIELCSTRSAVAFPGWSDVSR